MKPAQGAEGRRAIRPWWLASPLLGIVLLLPFGCGRPVDPWTTESGEPRIIVTVAPLYSFVRAVAGEDAAIKCLCTTTGPHHYEADFCDARLMEGADLVFAVGLALDDSFTDALY